MALGSFFFFSLFGDCVDIYGTDWRVEASQLVEAVPEALELRNYLRGIEKEYLRQRTKIEQIVTRDDAKVKLIRKKLEKLRKYMDDLFSDL